MENFGLVEFLRSEIVVETREDVLYDANEASEEQKDALVKNMLCLLESDEDWDDLQGMTFEKTADLETYLNNDPDSLNIGPLIICAAVMTFYGKNGEDAEGFHVGEDEYFITLDEDHYYACEMEVEIG